MGFRSGFRSGSVKIQFGFSSDSEPVQTSFS